jgi:hypothetical protein
MWAMCNPTRVKQEHSAPDCQGRGRGEVHALWPLVPCPGPRRDCLTNARVHAQQHGAGPLSPHQEGRMGKAPARDSATAGRPTHLFNGHIGGTSLPVPAIKHGLEVHAAGQQCNPAGTRTGAKSPPVSTPKLHGLQPMATGATPDHKTAAVQHAWWRRQRPGLQRLHTGAKRTCAHRTHALPLRM